MFPALIIVPSLQICWTLFSILSGMLYFQEYAGMQAGPTAMFVIGVAVSRTDPQMASLRLVMLHTCHACTQHAMPCASCTGMLHNECVHALMTFPGQMIYLCAG